MNTFFAWLGWTKPESMQIDKTATESLTRATYREVLLRNIAGSTELDTTISTYVFVSSEDESLDTDLSRRVFVNT